MGNWFAKSKKILIFHDTPLDTPVAQPFWLGTSTSSTSLRFHVGGNNQIMTTTIGNVASILAQYNVSYILSPEHVREAILADAYHRIDVDDLNILNAWYVFTSDFSSRVFHLLVLDSTWVTTRHGFQTHTINTSEELSAFIERIDAEVHFPCTHKTWYTRKPRTPKILRR